ncbi:sialate O-acetylesterase [Flagellimonas amoyensis]|uniref:sialate O-acetylesterase n=1 Tax=Flagellimonas amoyensis TaxID=2169401 RepID=UPI000D3635E8|nr:sialate O-acetylesterase [Allomuricauda amoyensis]
MNSTKNTFLGLLIVFFCSNFCFAKIWTPRIISDNMVLQQQSTVTIWGWTTEAAETITVKGSWNDNEVTTRAYQGSWSVKLSTPSAGGPFTLTISGHETINFDNIMIGEVWIASGQSNMEWTPNMGLDNADEEIQNADYPNIRFFTVPKFVSDVPVEDTYGEWVSSSPKTMQNFSSVGYFFGRKLHKDLSIPIGIISSNWGGTPIEVWMARNLIENDKELNDAKVYLEGSAGAPKTLGTLYNGMIYPLAKFKIAGVIWYQGESNRVNAKSYYKSFPMLIRSWRALWEEDFPFLYAQIAPYTYVRDTQDLKAALIRDAQLTTLKSVENTGMAVTNDIGNLDDIHPRNKQEVGHRLALWALAKTYGIKGIPFSGPVYKSMEINKNKIVVHFEYAEHGLRKKGKELNEFYIAGVDEKFYPAKAKIDGNTVIVSSSKVKNPIAVRFAFYDKALPNLYNSHDLPASAFRTDNFDD